MDNPLADAVILMGSEHLIKLFSAFRRGTIPRYPLSGCVLSVVCSVVPYDLPVATALLISDAVSFSVESSVFAMVERSDTGQAFSAAEKPSASADDLSVVELEVAPHFECLSLRMMLFLVPTLFWSSRYVLCMTTVMSRVTPIYY